MVSGVPVPLAIMATLGIGALCGVFSGMLVAYAGLQPLS
jgi:ribose transport system permease protein